MLSYCKDSPPVSNCNIIMNFCHSVFMFSRQNTAVNIHHWSQLASPGRGWVATYDALVSWQSILCNLMPIALKAPANICTISESTVVKINLAPCHMMRDANVTDYMANAQISGLVQDSVSPVLMHWRYCSLAQSLTCIAAVRIWVTFIYISSIVLASHPCTRVLHGQLS